MLRGSTEIRVDDHRLHADLGERDAKARDDHGLAAPFLRTRDLQTAMIGVEEHLEVGPHRAILLLEGARAFEIPSSQAVLAGERAFAGKAAHHGRAGEIRDVGRCRDAAPRTLERKHE